MIEAKNETLQKEIKTIISEILEIEEENITPEASFVEDLGMDSMMALEIMAAIEKKYKLKIPEENLTKMTNLKQVLEIIAKFRK